MATKHYCDACSEEIEGRVYELNYLCHIEDGGMGMHGYVDTKFHEPVSGRMCKKDLCLSCYNKIHFKAYEVFKNISSK